MYQKRGTETISDNKKVCIIGAGASGLMSAISAARCGACVTVLEHKESAGKKLLLTGNGKCNFTNRILNASCYHNYEGSRICSFIRRFDNDAAIDFFRSIGIKSTESDGYVYPESRKAEDVVNALLYECQKLGVKFQFNVSEISIEKLRDTYDAVIIATGGRSYPKTGSNGSGYKFLERLGVRYSRVLPALCAVYSDNPFCCIHKGERVLGRVSLVIGGKVSEYSATGEIQITDYGFSGIPVFQISRYASKAIDNDESVELIADFDISKDDVPEFLRNHTIKPEYSTVRANVLKTSGFDKAQVCTGGVELEKLDDNLQIIDAPNVYLCGEIIDVDGICGGYNLQWAWTSGYIAGSAAGGKAC